MQKGSPDCLGMERAETGWDRETLGMMDRNLWLSEYLYLWMRYSLVKLSATIGSGLQRVP